MSQIELTEAGGQGDEGYYRPRSRNPQMFQEAAQMLQAAWHGSGLGARARLQEAMASSDFRDTTMEIIDRETMERYAEMTPAWPAYCRRVLVRDFKPTVLVDLLGGLAGYDAVPEFTEYKERRVSKGKYTVSVSKRGARFAFSWESWVNDELHELESLPEALAIAARNTESKEAANLLTDGTGPDGAFFNSTAIGGTVSNLMTGNPALTSTSLATAIQTIKARVDTDGNPIEFPSLTLVVPPALEITARSILNATEIVFQEGADGAGMRRLRGTNWMASSVNLAVEPWLPLQDTAGTNNTTWYLVPTPASGRYALAMAFLRGHEQPEVRVKANAGRNVGGGDLDPTEGSFEIDDIQYRGRHVLGSGYGDPIGTIVSTGAGS